MFSYDQHCRSLDTVIKKIHRKLLAFLNVTKFFGWFLYFYSQNLRQPYRTYRRVCLLQIWFYRKQGIRNIT